MDGRINLMTDEEIEKSYMTDEGYEEWSRKVITDIKNHEPTVFERGNGGNYISKVPKAESWIRIKDNNSEFSRHEYE